MKVLNSLFAPISIEGDLKIVNFKLLATGKFVYEGFGRNRFLRYLGDEKTYNQVRGIEPTGKDLRTHNIDLLGNAIYIENNNSQDVILRYADALIARKAFIEIIGADNERFINSNRMA